MENLPEKWAVKRTADNYEKVNEYFNYLFEQGRSYYDCTDGFMHNGGDVSSEDLDFRYTLLTSDQFMQLVYNPWKAKQNRDGWVKYSDDNMPKVGRYLVVTRNLFKNPTIDVATFGDSLYWIHDGLGNIDKSVTHWRELPEPPKS